MNMTPITIALLSFVTGGAITGLTMWSMEQKADKDDIATIVQSLETKFEQAQASAVTNLTEPDLLKIPCSAEYISTNGDLLCREMFCRMNRQGGGQNSGGGAGATESDCSAISGVSVNLLKVNTCMQYWSDGAGQDQNSQYSRCITIFGQKP
jgi:hypothetical protein